MQGEIGKNKEYVTIFNDFLKINLNIYIAYHEKVSARPKTRT